MTTTTKKLEKHYPCPRCDGTGERIEAEIDGFVQTDGCAACMKTGKVTAKDWQEWCDAIHDENGMDWLTESIRRLLCALCHASCSRSNRWHLSARHGAGATE
jgi:hypothetical protein